jgi:predicted ATPase
MPIVCAAIIHLGAGRNRRAFLLVVFPRGAIETEEALGRLVAAGLVFQRGLPPAAECQFKHALVQDTAYGSLLRGPRQALHARIAAALQ